MANTPNYSPNMEDILDNARAIVNDSYNNGAGEILIDTAPFTLPYINASLQELQDRLGNNGEVTLIVDNYIVSGLETVSNNPALQTNLSVAGYSGYTNTFSISQVQVASNIVTVTIPGGTAGIIATMPMVISGLSTATYLNGQTLTVVTVTSTTFTALFTFANSGPTTDSGVAVNTLDPTLILPVDLLSPIFLWERKTNSNLPFVPMSQPQEGLQSHQQSVVLGEYEWRTGAIWFRGATTLRDIRIRYRKQEAAIAPNTLYTNVIVDLPGSFNALSYLIAYRYAMSRITAQTVPIVQALRLQADAHIKELIKRSVRGRQGIEYRRPPYGQRTNNRNRFFPHN